MKKNTTKLHYKIFDISVSTKNTPKNKSVKKSDTQIQLINIFIKNVEKFLRAY